MAVVVSLSIVLLECYHMILTEASFLRVSVFRIVLGFSDKVFRIKRFSEWV